MADFGSRWGIKGSSEASEGLTVVYRYERKINSTDASDPGGRLSYVGLSGGFGTITMGQVWGAAYNHFGGIVDQGLNYSSPGMTGYRFGDTLSYAVSVGSVSLQADAIMDQDTKKTGDAFNFGATMAMGESGSIAIAHRNHMDGGLQNTKAKVAGTKNLAKAYSEKQEASSSFIAGNYGIGDMTVFLGYSQDSIKDADCVAADDALDGNEDICLAKGKVKTTYAGVHGGVGDTGVSYVFTMRTKKQQGSGFGTMSADGTFNNNSANPNVLNEKNTPWTLGLSRSLGGGATVKFEHSDPDSDSEKSSSALWLHVNF